MNKNMPWNDDKLERKEEGDYLISYLLKRYNQNKDSNFVLNVNAEWGYGKTYFLDNLAFDLKSRNHPVVYFDAWKNDFSNKPLLAFISELDNQLTDYFPKEDVAKKTFVNKLKKVKDSAKPMLVGFLVNRLTHFGMDAILDDSSTEDEEGKDAGNVAAKNAEKASLKYVERALEEHQSIKKSIASFKKSIMELLNHVKVDDNYSLPLMIMIDELDRCRPNYAIEFLEIIKHLFDIPNITFIIATDSKQLSHSINAVYGANFASERYLKRFFDQEYTLKTPENYNYIYYIFEKHELLDDEKLFSGLDKDLYTGKDLNVVLFNAMSDYFQLVPRDINQCITMLSTITLTWNEKEDLHLGYLSFLIMLKHKSNDMFNKFIEVNNFNMFFKENMDESIRKEAKLLFKDDVLIDRYEYYYDAFGRISEKSKEKLSMRSMITAYDNLRSMSGSTLHSLAGSKNSVIKKLFGTIEHFKSTNEVITTVINQYPKMILQAGQFSN